MRTYFFPWQLYFIILTGWINLHQQQVIDYLRAKAKASSIG